MTIIIPAYNCHATLGRTLKSLIEQSFKDFKVLIVDDCSTENLYEVIDQYNDKLNITVVKTPYNQGCGGARQKGIETVSTSDNYIIFVDADDILLPNAVEVLQTAIRNEPDIVITPFLIKELNGKVRLYNFQPHGSGTFMMHGKAYNTRFLQQHQIYSHIDIKYFFNDWFLNHLALNYTANINVITTPIALYIKTANSATTTEDNRTMYMAQMRNLSHSVLSNELQKRGIKFERLYYANENKIIRIFRECRQELFQYINKIKNKYKI